MEKYKIIMCDYAEFMYENLSTNEKRKLAKQMRNYFNSALQQRYHKELWHQEFSSSEY